MNSIVKIVSVLLILCISAGYSVFGQQPYFREIAGTSNFDNARIKCIYQDHSGFIWIGTSKGLYKYDGLYFKPLSPSDSFSRISISSITEDYSGKIWFGYENGYISSYDKFNNTFGFPYGIKPQTKINCILQYPDSSLLFGTYGEGIYIWKEDNFRNINTSSGLSDDYIYTMVIDDHNRIWVGTDNGINIVDLSSGSLSISHLSVKDGLPDFIVQALEKDRQGRIWIGTYDYGLCYFDLQKDQFVLPLSMENWEYGPVKDILALQNRVWITTENKGMIDYNISTGEMLQYQKCNNINLDRINSMIPDNEGNIWLITNTEICLSFGPKIEFLSGHSTVNIDNIHALTVDSRDNVWYANDNGLFRFNPNSSDETGQMKHFQVKLDLVSQKIMSIYEDPFGYIWIGTFGNGIIRLNPENGRQIQITERHGLANGNILSIKGTSNDIWFATLGGASKCNISGDLSSLDFIPEFVNYQQEEGLNNNFIYHLYIDKDNRVWFATDGSGVSYYENGSFNNLANKTEFDKKVVYSVAGDRFGNIWMNIANEGLYKYDGSTVSRYLDDPAHENLTFSGILSNNNNELIIAYDDGIDVLNTETGDIIHFEGNAGLSDCNPDLNTLAADSKGNIWIGTATGLVKYAGMSVPVNTKPTTIINQVSVFLKQIDHQKLFSFPSSENHFSFVYSGLWYQYPGKVEYLIQLEGHDLDWIMTKNNSVIYSDLKPGKYTYKVKSALYNNFENASIATYSFTINKPFWASAWFYILLAIAIGMMLYFYIKYRENRIRIKQDAIREKIKFQFENLKNQINPHFLFNSFSTLMALIESDQEGAIEYVEELSALFRNTLEYKDQDVIDIKKELTIIENYYKLQKKRYGNNLDLKISPEVGNESIKIPPMTLQMLIENAIKHNIVSKDKPLKINIHLNANRSFLYIENNKQLKHENVNSTGIGIQNIISRYKLITDKKIEITQTGDLFKVGLPVIS